MALNYIWAGFFVVALVTALLRLIITGDTAVFPAILDSTFEMAKTGFTLSLGLTGLMTLWLGLMKIGEKGGVINLLSRAVSPFFSRLFPEIPKGHPATGSMIMNFSANLLGLDNAGLPLGLKAMKELQELNPNKEVASNAQIMFMVLNTSGLTIIPLAIILDRSILNAANPTDIFIPTLIATYCSSLFALIIVSIYQKINLFDKVILAYLGFFTALIAFVTWYFSSITKEQMQSQSALFSALVILGIIAVFIFMGLRRRIPIFETFIEGAKEGFETTIKIIPYLVGILVGIGVFRASGALDYIVAGLAFVFSAMGLNTDFVQSLPVAIMKPLSGSAAKGMMIEAVKTYGPDSFTGRLTSILRGCTETTFYILAVYFGSVNIRKTRYALTCGLLTDLVGVIAAIFIGYLFFH